MIAEEIVLTHIANSMRGTACVACLAVTLAIISASISVAETGTGSAACAAREVLLLALVEAHGAAPNVASEKLVAEGATIEQARAACDDGRVNDAVALYDRFIGELTTAMAHPNQ
jgi:hypothetical protein